MQLGRISPENGAAIYAKLEFLNPGGSVKDRAVLGLVLDAEQSGVLQPGGTVVEATAGNTRVGLAFIGVRRGYKVALFDRKAPRKKNVFSAGANVFASLALVRTMRPGQRLVTIIPDSAERYLSKKIFDGGL